MSRFCFLQNFTLLGPIFDFFRDGFYIQKIIFNLCLYKKLKRHAKRRLKSLTNFTPAAMSKKKRYENIWIDIIIAT